MSSSERFGYEWAKYSAIDPNYYLQFTKWVAPLTEADFRNASVLDAGCGMGRNSYWASKWGAKEVVAFDCDKRSVAAARHNLAGLPGVNVEFNDIYSITYENHFDLVMSIGVIHHLENPELAVKNLVRAAKPGGKIILWVYGREGNEGIIRVVNFLRRNFTSRLPVSFVHLIAYFLSVPVWLWVKIEPQRSPYFQQLSTFKFYHIHSIVFDQLIPRVANYWTREEALSLLAKQKSITDLHIYRVNNNSWTVIGRKVAVESTENNYPQEQQDKTAMPLSDFESWNERMAVKYNPDHYHQSKNPFINLITYLRTRAIIKLLAINPADQVLDLGCGTGHMLLKIKSGQLTGVDLSPYLLAIARQKLALHPVTLIYGNVEDLPPEVKAKTYDKILSSEVIEHIKSPQKMIEQITSVAKPTSLIVITFPYENLLNKIKAILHKVGLLQLLFKGIPTRMTDEWHLRFMDQKVFEEIIRGQLKIIKIKKVPFSLLPIHYIVLCQKI